MQHPTPEKQASAFTKLLLWVDLATYNVSRAQGQKINPSDIAYIHLTRSQYIHAYLAQIIETSGLDAAIYLRVLSFGKLRV